MTETSRMDGFRPEALPATPASVLKNEIAVDSGIYVQHRSAFFCRMQVKTRN